MLYIVVIPIIALFLPSGWNIIKIVDPPLLKQYTAVISSQLCERLVAVYQLLTDKVSYISLGIHTILSLFIRSTQLHPMVHAFLPPYMSQSGLFCLCAHA